LCPASLGFRVAARADSALDVVKDGKERGMLARRLGIAHRRLVAVALAATALSAAAAAGPAAAQTTGPCPAPVPLDAAGFPAEPLIDHGFLPLTPGTRWVLEEAPRQVTSVVTDVTKVIAGVRTRVVWHVDALGGVVSEAGLSFFAQDATGRVWSLGEYPEEYLNGAFGGAPGTWIHGLSGAQGGVALPAAPAVATPAWLQHSSSLGVDCASVSLVDQTTMVPAGTFTGVLVVEERSEGVAGTQLKHFAPGAGNIRAVDPVEAEDLALTSRTTLDAAGLQAAREAALTLDALGRQGTTVYNQTPAAEPPAGAPPFVPPPRAAPPPRVTNPPVIFVPTGPPAAGPPPLSAPGTGPDAPATQAGFVSRITNSYFPVSAFRSTTLRGTERDRRTGQRSTLRVVTRLRDRKVTIAGIRTTAVDVREYEDDELVERATDFYAQDRGGNVWYFGERVDEIENGRVVDHGGQWLAGTGGAKPGLFMPKAPWVGRTFQRERAPGLADDTSTVLARGLRVRTPLRRFSNCIRTSDFSAIDRGRESKYYCRGYGLVREGAAPVQLVAARRVR
jgi:hypothetical protein